MKNLKFATSSIESSREYLKTLNSNDYKNFKPAKSGLTKNGESLRLGFSTYGLKLYFMLGEWDKLSNSDKKNGSTFLIHLKKIIKIFQKIHSLIIHFIIITQNFQFLIHQKT